LAVLESDLEYFRFVRWWYIDGNLHSSSRHWGLFGIVYLPRPLFIFFTYLHFSSATTSVRVSSKDIKTARCWTDWTVDYSLKQVQQQTSFDAVNRRDRQTAVSRCLRRVSSVQSPLFGWRGLYSLQKAWLQMSIQHCTSSR
jgi:hypothetical protein